MIEKVCPICGKTFTVSKKNRKYCSQECRDEFWRIAKTKSKPYKDKVCIICGKTFTPYHHSEKYCCDTCRKIANREQSRQWYERNRQKALKYGHEYYSKNAEARKAYSRQKYLKNNPYPCKRYKQPWSIPKELCLNCEPERCRFDY